MEVFVDGACIYCMHVWYLCESKMKYVWTKRMDKIGVLGGLNGYSSHGPPVGDGLGMCEWMSIHEHMETSHTGNNQNSK